MSNLRVLIENGSGAYAQMFFNNGWSIADSVGDADLVQFEGGADVSPNMYGEANHPTTYSSELTDDFSIALFEEAQARGIPVAGICRGSQFLCVMGGGKLWQDVDNHAIQDGHSLIDVESGLIIPQCSSTHHQQHRPASNAIIIAEAFPQLCTHKANGKDNFDVGEETSEATKYVNQDVEAFYYEHINALGFQPHPEFFGIDHPCQKYYFDIIEKYLKLRA